MGVILGSILVYLGFEHPTTWLSNIPSSCGDGFTYILCVQLLKSTRCMECMDMVLSKGDANGNIT
jgi:hypothetical protein